MKLVLKTARLATALLCPVLATAEAAEKTPEAANPSVTANSAGTIKLGMSIAMAEAAMKEATFKRSADGEGVALVTVSIGDNPVLRLSAGEEDAKATVDEKALIEFIDVIDPSFKTAAGVHPGMSLEEAEKAYGKAGELVTSELEAREYVTFSNQPSGLFFRVSHKNGTAGIYKEGEMTTASYRPESEISVIEVTGADIMVDGRIGGLRLDSPEADVIAVGEKGKLGELTMGKDEIWAAFGEAVQAWSFNDSGLSANMISGEVGGPKAVLSITIEAPSTLKTERGIGIGSTRNEVAAAYADYRTEKEEAKNLAETGDMYLVGSIYGGMVFTFEDGKVSRIFLGATAE